MPFLSSSLCAQFEERAAPIGSEELAELTFPIYSHVIKSFGAPVTPCPAFCRRHAAPLPRSHVIKSFGGCPFPACNDPVRCWSDLQPRHQVIWPNAGPNKAMWESNFPVDKVCLSYNVLCVSPTAPRPEEMDQPLSTYMPSLWLQLFCCNATMPHRLTATWYRQVELLQAHRRKARADGEREGRPLLPNRRCMPQRRPTSHVALIGHHSTGDVRFIGCLHRAPQYRGCSFHRMSS